ncbi:tryptophan 2,3-dioxygenase [Kordiimonas aquimaris]|uniref:tryptophan 2,3-dioxygenase n=1 Tax=Kordiimonas aquimaris TaxID=707591 RepID=UPI0021D39ECE|nr:tryptophan 2,3-dioxygenase [Kordiimonas aquimaris]
MTKAYDPKDDGAEMSFDGRMSYGDYLQLHKVLDAQSPLSEAHDEYLFIIQHQTSELWMRLALHEMSAAKEAIQKDDLPTCFKMLTRVARIFEQLNSAWDVLRTMTPSEYTQFRNALGQSSGFQSYQYRAIEYLAGNKNEAMLQPHVHVEGVHSYLSKILSKTSIYDEVLKLLSRRGFDVSVSSLDRDWTQAYVADDSVINTWKTIYESPNEYWDLYELAEKLIDFEDYFRRWRFNHVTTVERIMGFKRGTGGTSGVGYLQKMLAVVLFPELWDVRTLL